MHIVRRLLLPVMVLAALAMTVRPAAAQVGVGIKGGPVFSNFNVDVEEVEIESKTRTGWMVGLFIDGNRRNVVGVGAEVNLIKRIAVDEFDSETSVYAVDIPVYLRLNGGSRDGSGVSFYGLVGPAFDINYKADEDGVDIFDEAIENFDLNLVVGGGVEIKRFIIEARYMKGLRDIAKDFEDISTTAKTSSFAVLFGVRFN